MEPSELFSDDGGGWGRGASRPSPRKELQGPRPATLKVNKDSFKIRKPPVPPPAHQQPPQEPPPVEERQPLIIYAVSPKVIHTTVSDFMNLVQRLTGNTSAATTSSGGAGDLSPAAHLASIEKTSPCSKDREISHKSISTSVNDDIMDSILESTDVEMDRVPGILSPAPATLPPISPGFFSTAGDPFLTGYSNMFIPSPSTLFSTPTMSPSQSWCDPFNPFFDF
ncbi:protein MKS1-like [Primulina tabacum]|uniref:protein MKS1-like n=1 Tax=Primulina tabacum TaxID=48773 RepID=UPI003F5AD822